MWHRDWCFHPKQEKEALHNSRNQVKAEGRHRHRRRHTEELHSQHSCGDCGNRRAGNVVIGTAYALLQTPSRHGSNRGHPHAWLQNWSDRSLRATFAT